MKAWQIDDFGLENLRLHDVPTPDPGPGEILAKVSAVSLNFRDKAVVDGVYEPDRMPKGLIPVSDAAGTVVKTEPQVTRFRAGAGSCRTCGHDGSTDCRPRALPTIPPAARCPAGSRST